MSTIKSSAENLTLNADGANNDIIFQSNGTTKATLDQAGLFTASALAVDNITIDGTEIDLSSGDLTIDVAGDIILDADGGDINFKDNGTSIFHISNDNSGDVHLESQVSNKDIYIRGNDGGSTINALYFDMSDAGKAIFNSGLAIGGTGAANTLSDYEEGTWTPTYTSSGSGLSVNYNTQVGRYVKVGKLVTCTVQINTSSVSGGSASHTLRLEGLPFTHNNSSPGGFRFGAAYGWNNLEPDVAQLSGGMLLFIDDAGDWVHTNTLQTSNDRNHAYSNFTYEIN